MTRPSRIGTFSRTPTPILLYIKRLKRVWVKNWAKNKWTQPCELQRSKKKGGVSLNDKEKSSSNKSVRPLGMRPRIFNVWCAWSENIMRTSKVWSSQMNCSRFFVFIQPGTESIAIPSWPQFKILQAWDLSIPLSPAKRRKKILLASFYACLVHQIPSQNTDLGFQ